MNAAFLEIDTGVGLGKDTSNAEKRLISQDE
jgi:hypothetical protein